MNHQIDFETEYKRYKERLLIGLKAAKICVFEVDLKSQLYTFFENAEDIFEVSGEIILKEVESFSSLSPSDYQKEVLNYFAHPDDFDTIKKAFQSIFKGLPMTYEARMKAGDTEFVWCKLDVQPIIEGGIPVRMIGVITDISSLKSFTQALENKTMLDVYHKAAVESLICEALSSAVDKSHALMVIDLDNFKKANDVYGHLIGDSIIKSVSNHLKRIFRHSDIIGRFGGDEFIVLMKNITNLEDVLSKARQILISDNPYQVTKSIGISLFPDNGNDYETLFYYADIALYDAKKTKNTYVLFKG